jgi:4-hydroxybenzoate polyprenyltransferase
LIKLWNFLKRELLLAGHLMAFGSVMVVFTTVSIAQVEVPIPILSSLYFIVQPIYWFDRWVGYNEDISGNEQRREHMSRYFRAIPGMMGIYALIAISILVFYEAWINLYIAIAFLVFGGLYGLVFKKITRYIVGFKNYFVAIFFVLFGIYGLVYAEESVSIPVLVFLMYVFIRSTLIQIFFDMKDIENDRNDGLRTIPAVIGIDRSWNLLSFLNILSGIIVVNFVVTGILDIKYLVFTVPVLILGIILSAARKKMKKECLIIAGFDYTIVAFLAILMKVLL